MYSCRLDDSCRASMLHASRNTGIKGFCRWAVQKTNDVKYLLLAKYISFESKLAMGKAPSWDASFMVLRSFLTLRSDLDDCLWMRCSTACQGAEESSMIIPCMTRSLMYDLRNVVLSAKYHRTLTWPASFLRPDTSSWLLCLLDLHFRAVS